MFQKKFPCQAGHRHLWHLLSWRFFNLGLAIFLPLCRFLHLNLTLAPSSHSRACIMLSLHTRNTAQGRTGPGAGSAHTTSSPPASERRLALAFELRPKEQEAKPLKSADSMVWAASGAPRFHWHKDRGLGRCVQHTGWQLSSELPLCKQAQAACWQRWLKVS